MAQYPVSIPSFTTKHNLTSIVDESDPNLIQGEVTAIATELGTNPRISTALATTYTDVKTRLEFIEANFRKTATKITTADVDSSFSTQLAGYVTTDGTRAFTGTSAIAAAPVGVNVGDAQNAGTANTLARSDHRHAVSAGAPAASAVGDAQTTGVAATFAASDHKHAREAFGAVTAQTTFGASSSTGSATTVAHSDHTHGTPAAGATPSTQAFGDSAAAGSGPGAAFSDHKHAMPALGTTVTDGTFFGASIAVGTSPKAAHEDHSHGTPSASLTGPTAIMAVWPTNTPPGGWLICDGSAVSRSTYSALFAVIGSTYGSGDGSTTFNLPDCRTYVVAGRKSGDTNFGTLGGTLGTTAETLSTSQIPSHNHSSPTGGESATHTHSGTSNSEAGHTHGTGNAGDHTHSMYPGWGGGTDIVAVSVGGPQNSDRLVQFGTDAAAYTGAYITYGHTYGPGDHNHGATGSGSSHNHSFSTGTDSGGHTHTIASQGGGSSHNNIQPTMVLNWIIKF